MDRTWLARTVEEVVEPELEICDPHHHLWLASDRHVTGYDLDDLRVDTGSGHRVVDTVFVECAAEYRPGGPAALRPLGETEFVVGRAERSDDGAGARIAAIVGHADLLLGERIADVLHAHGEAGRGRFRGIRHSAAFDPSPAVPRSHSAPPPQLYRRPEARAALATLGGLELSFDAWQFHPQLGELAEAAEAVPGTTFVVDHVGAPLGIGPYAGRRAEVLDAWRPPMRRLAACPNVVLKVGGIGMARYGVGFETWPAPPSSDQLLAVWGDELRWCIDTFGPSRCMFESNYPVDGESCSYVVLWNAFKKVSAGYTPAERADLFAGTARRTYRLTA